MQNKKSVLVIANDEELREKKRLKMKYAPIQPTKFLNVVGKKYDCFCVVTYDINKTSDTSNYVTENYEVYEHTTKKDKLLVKQKIENLSYEKNAEDAKKVDFFEKDSFEFATIPKPENFDEKFEFIINQKSNFTHKRLSRECQFVDPDYVIQKDYYFVTDVKLKHL